MELQKKPKSNLLNRIKHKRKASVSQDEVSDIEIKARVAEAFLENEEFAPIRDLISSYKESIKKQILDNTVRDVTEEVSIGNSVKKFFTPRKLQLDELSGRYKMLVEFVETLENWVEIKQKLSSDLANENVIIK